MAWINPPWKRIHCFIDVPWSEWSWITDPDQDHIPQEPTIWISCLIFCYHDSCGIPANWLLSWYWNNFGHDSIWYITNIQNFLDIQHTSKLEIKSNIERFSFECRKVIGFALSTRCDWLKRFAPPFHPIRSKTKANCDALARFSRALRQPHVITSSFDWFNVLSVSYVIGQSNYFGFGFTTLKRKPLYTIMYILVYWMC